MRTARLIAVDAGGDETILCPAKTPISESLAKFRQFEASKKLPAGIAAVIWQASDGGRAKIVKVDLPAIAQPIKKQKEKKNETV